MSGRGAGVRKSLPARGASAPEDAQAPQPTVIPNQVNTSHTLFLHILLAFTDSPSANTCPFFIYNDYSRIVHPLSQGTNILETDAKNTDSEQQFVNHIKCCPMRDFEHTTLDAVENGVATALTNRPTVQSLS